MPAARPPRQQPSDLQRSCSLANKLIDLINKPRAGVTIRHAVVAAHIALRETWHAGGGSDGGLIAYVANALDDSPAMYYGQRSRLVH